MPYLSSPIRGQRKSKPASEAACDDSPDRVWARVEAERRALEAWTVQLRALRLAPANVRA
jgi:hypothetical protein